MKRIKKIIKEEIKNFVNNIINESYKSVEESYYGQLITISFNIIHNYFDEEDKDYFITQFKLNSFETTNGNYRNVNEICDEFDIEYYFGTDIAQELIDCDNDITDDDIISDSYDENNERNVIYKEITLNILDSNNLTTNNINDINEYLKKYYGESFNYQTAFYLLTDGTMLSGGSNIVRDIDHHSLEGLLNKDLESIMQMGIIRLMPESPGFDLRKLPTEEQFNILKRWINFFSDKTIYIDFGNKVYGKYYKPHYQEIINDIYNYFLDDIKPVN